MPRSEIDSLNEQADEKVDKDDGDEIELVADPLHSGLRAIGCIQPKYARLQLGFPVIPKEMDTAFSTLRRSIGETMAARMFSTSEKTPFSGVRS